MLIMVKSTRYNRRMLKNLELFDLIKMMSSQVDAYHVFSSESSLQMTKNTPEKNNKSFRIHKFDSEIFEKFISSFEGKIKFMVERKITPYISTKFKDDPALSRGDQLKVLALNNENCHSDWLAFFLEENGKANSIGNRISTVFGTEFSEGVFFDVEREVRVDYGHDEQTGRVDILLTNEKLKRFQLIEVKVREPTKTEIEKHNGYVCSMLSSHHYKDWTGTYILLTPEKYEYGLRTIYGIEFKNVTWKDIGLVLRRYLLDSDGKINHTNALVSLFCSSMEASLLNFPVKMFRKYLKDGDGFLYGITANSFLSYIEEAYEL